MTKKAIILGVTGLVGRAVAQCLLSKGVEVCGIARAKDFSYFENSYKNFKYISSDINSLNHENIKYHVKEWLREQEGVVLNFAWRGCTRLRDGSLEEQLKNINLCSEAITFAHNIDVGAFVQAGSQDEKLYGQYLSNDNWKVQSYPADMINYAAAKYFAKEMNQLVAYLNQVDYVHTRFSAVVPSDLSSGGYIPSTIAKIIRHEYYEKPVSPQLYDLVLLDDLAEMYYAVFLYGENQKDYYLGSGNPKRLSDFFSILENKSSGKSVFINNTSNIDINHTSELFNNNLIKELCAKTGSQAANHDFNYLIQRVSLL